MRIIVLCGWILLFHPRCQAFRMPGRGVLGRSTVRGTLSDGSTTRPSTTKKNKVHFTTTSMTTTSLLHLLMIPNPFLQPGDPTLLPNTLFQNSEDTAVTTSIASTTAAHLSSTVPPPPSSLRSYEYDGWKLSYRYRPASPGYEQDPPFMLIHPVGIGLASWFWEPLMNQPGPAMYAPNLIGCGISEGGDSWDPLERGLFIPLGWVKGCEALLQQIVKGEKEKNDSSIQQQFAPTNLFKNSFKSFPLFGNKKVNVVTQGGLAPIGVLLAARNPNVVQSLVMASPPTWKDMTNPVPREELERNYGFLRSPILGDLAFRVLESRRAIEFFSNQFLFSKQCDDVWLKKTESEFGVQARPPVQVFNAGFCMNRGLETELTSLTQPTIIVQGQEDKRERKEYVEMMKNCRIQVSPGKNVIPWEFPQDFANLLFGRY